MTTVVPRPWLSAVWALSLVSGPVLEGPSLAQAAETWPEPARVIYPGEVIRDDMLIDTAPSELTGLASIATDHGSVVGKVARRTLLPNHPIAMSAVVEKALVVSGHIIEAAYVHESLSIIAKVMALQDGRPGDLIEVRSLDSGKIITGIVQADGTVRMPVR